MLNCTDSNREGFHNPVVIVTVNPLINLTV